VSDLKDEIIAHSPISFTPSFAQSRLVITQQFSKGLQGRHEMPSIRSVYYSDFSRKIVSNNLGFVSRIT